MRKILIFLLLIIIAPVVQATEYDLYDLLTNNPDQRLVAGDVLIGSDHPSPYPNWWCAFFGEKGKEEIGNNGYPNYLYLDSRIHHVCGSYEGSYPYASKITIPDFGSNCSWDVKVFTYSVEQLYLTPNDDSCLNKIEPFQCEYDCATGMYNCFMRVKNYLPGTYPYLGFSPDWNADYLRDNDHNYGYWIEHFDLEMDDKNDNAYRDLSIIENLRLFNQSSGIDVKLEKEMRHCSYYDSRVYGCTEGEYYDNGREEISIKGLVMSSYDNIEPHSTFDFISFQINPERIDYKLSIRLLPLAGNGYYFSEDDETYTLYQETPICDNHNAVVPIEPNVLGENENVVNPKTGVRDILKFVIPAIILIIVALIPIFKEEIFKKI